MRPEENFDRLRIEPVKSPTISAASGTGPAHHAAQILQAFSPKSVAKSPMCSASRATAAIKSAGKLLHGALRQELQYVGESGGGLPRA